MASRYWVGGTGTWNSTNTTNWSATSGGAGGASVPTSADDVFINGSSGSGTITTSSAPQIKSINTTGYTGAINGFVSTTAASALIFGATGTYTSVFLQTSGPGGGSLTTNGKALGTVQITLSSGTFTLNDNLTAGNVTTSGGNAGTVSGVGRTVTLTSTTITSFNGSITLGTLTSGGGAINLACGSSASVSIGTVTSLYGINTSSSASCSVSAVTSYGLSNVFFCNHQSTGSVSFPKWPTLASEGINGLSVIKSNTGSISPAISGINFNGYPTSIRILLSSSNALSISSISSASVDIDGAGVSVTTASAGTTGFFVRNSASASTVTCSGSATFDTNGSVGSLTVNGTAITFQGYTSSSTTAATTITATNANLSINGSNNAGRIGTFNYNTSGGNLAIDSALTTFNANALNLGPNTGSMIVRSTTPSGTRARLTANSSFTLKNIEWRGIEASGVVPFTGTGFVDGGNNLNISFPAAAGVSSGLFFGSNF